MSFSAWWRNPALQLAAAALAMGALFLLGNYLPALEALRLLLPGAVLISLAALGLPQGLLALGLSAAAVFGLSLQRGPMLQDFLLSYAALGLVVYLEARRGRRGYRLVGSSLLIYLALVVGGTYLSSYWQGRGLPLLYSGGAEQLDAVIEQLRQDPRGAWLEAETLKRTALLVSPAFFLVGALATTLFTIWLGEPVLRRCLGYRERMRLSSFHLPERLIWLFIAAVLLSLSPWAVSHGIGLNLLLLLIFLYLFQGLAVVSSFLQRLPFNPLLRSMILFSILFFPFTLIAALLLGLLDFYFDFRRFKLNKGERHESDSD